MFPGGAEVPPVVMLPVELPVVVVLLDVFEDDAEEDELLEDPEVVVEVELVVPPIAPPVMLPEPEVEIATQTLPVESTANPLKQEQPLPLKNALVGQLLHTPPIKYVPEIHTQLTPLKRLLAWQA